MEEWKKWRTLSLIQLPSYMHAQQHLPTRPSQYQDQDVQVASDDSAVIEV